MEWVLRRGDAAGDANRAASPRQHVGSTLPVLLKYERDIELAQVVVA